MAGKSMGHPYLRSSLLGCRFSVVGFRSVLLALVFALAPAALAQQPAGQWDGVAKALGRAGEDAGGVYRVAFPRSDLRVRVAGVYLRTGLALTSWLGFQQTEKATIAMGDLVLLVSEVSPVVSKLAEAGIAVTGVHAHMLGEQPRVVHVHFRGSGDAAKLASDLRGVLALTATPLTTPRPRASQETSPLDAELLSRILGHTGSVGGGVVSFSIPRREKIVAGGVTVRPRMGVATAINFQAEGSGAVAAGDFVLLAQEIQPVIRVLRERGLEVTAVHNHMLDEQPRLFFVHFWGRGETEKLARSLRAALDLTNHERSQ